MNYKDFIEAKKHSSINYGFDKCFLNDKMFDFQKYVTEYAIKNLAELKNLKDEQKTLF